MTKNKKKSQFYQTLSSKSVDSENSFVETGLVASKDTLELLSHNLNCGNLIHYYTLQTRLVTIIIDLQKNTNTVILGRPQQVNAKSITNKKETYIYSYFLYTESGFFLLLGVDIELQELFSNEILGDPFLTEDKFCSFVENIKSCLHISNAQYHDGDTTSIVNLETFKKISFFALTI